MEQKGEKAHDRLGIADTLAGGAALRCRPLPAGDRRPSARREEDCGVEDGAGEAAGEEGVDRDEPRAALLVPEQDESVVEIGDAHAEIEERELSREKLLELVLGRGTEEKGSADEAGVEVVEQGDERFLGLRPSQKGFESPRQLALVVGRAHRAYVIAHRAEQRFRSRS